MLRRLKRKGDGGGVYAGPWWLRTWVLWERGFRATPGMIARLELAPAELWVGVRVETTYTGRHVRVGLLPGLQLHLQYLVRARP